MSTRAVDATVFLCHGAGGDAGSMGALANALRAAGCADARALAYPGREGNEGLPRDTVAALAEAVRDAVRAALGDLDRPHVMLGHSMGGAVAIEYALDPPRGLEALVLVSTGARLRVHPSILAALEATDGAEDTNATQAPGASASFARGLEQSRRAPRPSALADWRAANAFDRMDRIHELTLPTLIVVGENDILTPLKYARFLHEHIPGAQLETLPGAGHSLPTEHPSRVAELTERFLASLPTRTGGPEPTPPRST
ncbi:MAG: alpha/beta hydrolase [Polyangiales bacterium]